jgi:hypothetical protein
VEWHDEDVALIYDLTLLVFDCTGVTLVKRIQNRDNLGGNTWNPPSDARATVPKAFKPKLEVLLDDPSISAAIRRGS